MTNVICHGYDGYGGCASTVHNYGFNYTTLNVMTFIEEQTYLNKSTFK